MLLAVVDIVETLAELSETEMVDVTTVGEHRSSSLPLAPTIK